jgi:heat shock protein HslJ
VLTTLLDGATATSVVSGTAVTLRLEQGKANGSAGCNTYGGPYTRQANTLTFGAVAATKMSCQGLAGLMEQEGQYLELLQRVTSFELDGGQLTQRADDGSGLVFRAR